jgi:hypothetical protein
MYYRELKESYRRVRTFLPSLLQTVRFGATPAGRPVLEALEFLRKPEEPEDRPHLGDPPLAIVTRAWRQYVFGDGERIDRKAFVFCFLDRSAQHSGAVIYSLHPAFDMRTHESVC